ARCEERLVAGNDGGAAERPPLGAELAAAAGRKGGARVVSPVGEDLRTARRTAAATEAEKCRPRTGGRDGERRNCQRHRENDTESCRHSSTSPDRPQKSSLTLIGDQARTITLRG